MKDLEHIDHLLHEYLDGTLHAGDVQDVDAHLRDCPDCRTRLEELRILLQHLHALPRSITPSHDLWQGIKARLGTTPPEAFPVLDSGTTSEPVGRAARRPVARSWFSRRLSGRAFAVAAVVAMVAMIVLFQWWRSSRSWHVTPLAGSPIVAEQRLERPRTLRIGEWLETDAASRAEIEVGTIGYVEVGPDTRLQLRNVQREDHRMALTRGRIHARIWAPPRLFYVETPSATAIDLGCEYTLEVDSTGGSLLHVLSGYVGVEHGTRESVVPAGWMCRTRRGHLPGTPYADDAPTPLREALFRFDFEGGHPHDLETVLSEARPADALTVWELILRVPRPQQARVYDRLAELVAPPPGVTRAGVLQGDNAMHRAWRKKLGVDVLSWSDAQKAKKKKRREATRAP